nr:probable LRR receptor-like serine/threonine-protein kinase At1g74360 [Ipomoea batatas]
MVSHLTGLRVWSFDVSVNRFRGDVKLAFPRICDSLVAVNISSNLFTGEIGNTFKKCGNLKFLDLSLNNLPWGFCYSGLISSKSFLWFQNSISGTLPWWVFNQSCSLQSLDLSENKFFGGFPKEISNCKDLRLINLSGNNFSGPIPKEIGSLQSLEGLFLLLYGKGYTGGIVASGINQAGLQALDLSSNGLNGTIPPSLGRLTSLLGANAGKQLTDREIPPELGIAAAYYG